jgi:hypothetical protein
VFLAGGIAAARFRGNKCDLGDGHDLEAVYDMAASRPLAELSPVQHGPLPVRVRGASLPFRLFSPDGLDCYLRNQSRTCRPSGNRPVRRAGTTGRSR